MRPFLSVGKRGAAGATLLLLSACGTTYSVPTAGDAEVEQARMMFAEERNPATARSGARLTPAMAIAQYRAVVARVEPIAEAFCRTATAERDAFDCDVTIIVDEKANYRNAFQTYMNGRPVVGFTLPFIADARNPDELAFVLGHEFGHHIGEHMKKRQQQEMAGAIILGALTAYGQAVQTQANPYRSTAMDSYDMQNSIAAGAALGHAAYSQTFELESDVIGAYIAEAAGYDPVKGALFFARPESGTTADGTLSFWGTHPPSEKRLATVVATVNEIRAGREISAAE